eukprot:1161755-Pelagomonas_calceolata.AAC.12
MSISKDDGHQKHQQREHQRGSRASGTSVDGIGRGQSSGHTLKESCKFTHTHTHTHSSRRCTDGLHSHWRTTRGCPAAAALSAPGAGCGRSAAAAGAAQLWRAATLHLLAAAAVLAVAWRAGGWQLQLGPRRPGALVALPVGLAALLAGAPVERTVRNVPAALPAGPAASLNTAPIKQKCVNGMDFAGLTRLQLWQTCCLAWRHTCRSHGRKRIA